MFYWLCEILFRQHSTKIRKKSIELISPKMLDKYRESKLDNYVLNLIEEPYKLRVGTKRGNCYYVRMEGRIGKCTVKHLLNNQDSTDNTCFHYNKYTAFNCPCILNSKKR